MMETRPGMNAIHKLNHELINNPLTISLGGNKLVLVNGEKWVSETSDLEEARRREQELVKENDSLKLRLMLLMEQMEFAARETVELKQLNGAAMDMLADQRVKIIQLESQLGDCKEELRESYRAAVEIKNSFESLHAKIEVNK